MSDTHEMSPGETYSYEWMPVEIPENAETAVMDGRNTKSLKLSNVSVGVCVCVCVWLELCVFVLSLVCVYMWGFCVLKYCRIKNPDI